MLAQGALTIAGVGAGLLGSAALTRFLATMLFEIAPTDAIIFCAVATLLAGVAVLACVAPAVRAPRLSFLIVHCRRPMSGSTHRATGYGVLRDGRYCATSGTNG